ncbi:hypothetical protein [Streptomyces sp. sk2.1]|uniref:hypothetical protein n=1 Tax=Streptomyces sp. sk2.1 TaxID=2478959 RepID=UPI0011E767BA|nr:hypothetical protein [Streptomyces sp. sk2.1]
MRPKKTKKTKKTLLVAVAACAALAAPAFTGTAAAAGTVTASGVETSWGHAHVKAQWRLDPCRLDPLHMSVKDTAADGHSVGVRLITEGDAGTHCFLPHRVSTGNGTGWAGDSCADPGGRIASAWIELCRMEGATALSCVSSKVVHAPFDDSTA